MDIDEEGPEGNEKITDARNQKVVVKKEQLKKEKRKISSQILWLLLLVNFFVGAITFATVYQLYIPTFMESLLFSFSVIMGALTIEGVILIFLGLVTKERNYADILMRTANRRTFMMMSQESREREIETFNQLVIFTKKLFLIIGSIFTGSGILYFLLPMILSL